MKRPSIRNNEEMMKELAKIVASDYLNEDSADENTIERICRSLKYHYQDDAYELAKDLENRGFDIDSDIVSNLESVYRDSRKIEQNYIKNWVIENNIEPKLNIGTEVKISKRYKSESGTIKEVDRDIAQYAVNTPDQKETSRWLINYEDLEELNQTEL